MFKIRVNMDDLTDPLGRVLLFETVAEAESFAVHTRGLLGGQFLVLKAW